MSIKKPRQKRFRRGIYWLPSFFTIGAMFLGFYSIILASQGRFVHSVIAILMAMVMDGLDGRVARMTGTQSEFGAELDSLSDLISFGLAPALLVYFWILFPLGKLGWMVAFIYTACGALRLARFNSQSESESPRYFRGLSIPMAACVLSSSVWLCLDYGIQFGWLPYLMSVCMVLVGLLMVTTIRYRSFKDINTRGRVSFHIVLAFALLFALITYSPSVVLFFLSCVYALSGFLLFVLSRLKRS